MPNEFTRLYSTGARFDYIKLSFPDIHPVHARHVEDVISFALGKVYDTYGVSSLKLPKVTVLEPSHSRPNGQLLIEAYGLAAQLALYLPAFWLHNLTYVHVKSFLAQPGGGGVLELKQAFEGTSGLLTFTTTTPGSASRTQNKAPLPSLRLGSRKSGTHFVLYQRPYGPVGLESRFRDEAVKDIAQLAVDLGEKMKLDDAATWTVALFRWAQRGAEKFSHECYRRELDPHALGYPVTYEESAGAAAYETLVEQFKAESGNSYGD